MLRKAYKFLSLIHSLPRDIQYIRESLGRIEARQVRACAETIDDDTELEFIRNGEKMSYPILLNKILPAIRLLSLALDYTESNPFLVSSTWSGLVIDGSSDNIRKLR